MKNLNYTLGKVAKTAALTICYSSLFVVSAVDKHDTSYMELDKNIVKAYNSKPRNTAEVYVNSVYILKKADKDEKASGSAWKLKAKKLITVSCFYECTKAIDKKLYRKAYIWAQRGIKSGTSFGKIGDTPVNNLYSYLNFASNELKKTSMVKNSNPLELQKLIDNVNNTAAGPGQQSASISKALLKIKRPVLPSIILRENTLPKITFVYHPGKITHFIPSS